MTDLELIKKFLDGEVNAFNTLVWRWQKSLYNFILRYVGDREEAKDLCQKTFIRVYQNLRRLRDPKKFSSWIYQIAINICRDELKRHGRNNTFSLESLQEKNNGQTNQITEMVTNPTTNPDVAVINLDLRDLLHRALREIPEEQRLVIIMKEYQGLKFTEIADILQTSVNTVKSRMYYGLSALKKVFNKWKINEEMLKYEV
ncbi:MAG: RNA polymerase sigma factor [bacterium]